MRSPSAAVIRTVEGSRPGSSSVRPTPIAHPRKIDIDKRDRRAVTASEQQQRFFCDPAETVLYQHASKSSARRLSRDALVFDDQHAAIIEEGQYLGIAA